ncbi:matrixin family metalloprotease [bacterium]|nr:matrixin family metalloprotease [bacterium]
MLGCAQNEKEKVQEGPTVESVSNTVVTSKRKIKKLKVGAKWDTMPGITLCPGVPVTIERIKEAVLFWEDLGYRFDDIDQVPSTMLCQPSWGTITFRVPTGEELTRAVADGHLATTRYSTLVSSPESLIMAQIYFQRNNVSELPLVVEHELGHALGWLHHDLKGHLMHPVYSSTGHNTQGVEWSEYQKSAPLIK